MQQLKETISWEATETNLKLENTSSNNASTCATYTGRKLSTSFDIKDETNQKQTWFKKTSTDTVFGKVLLM